MNALVTTTELLTLSGLRRQTLRCWIAKGLLRPIVTGSRGRGNSDRFSMDQVKEAKIRAGMLKRLRDPFVVVA